MQYGPRITYGDGCPKTTTGAHLVEFNETGTRAWCCQCALELSDLERRKAFLKCRIEDRRAMMAAGAAAMADTYTFPLCKPALNSDRCEPMQAMIGEADDGVTWEIE